MGWAICAKLRSDAYVANCVNVWTLIWFFVRWPMTSMNDAEIPITPLIRLVLHRMEHLSIFHYISLLVWYIEVIAYAVHVLTFTCSDKHVYVTTCMHMRRTWANWLWTDPTHRRRKSAHSYKTLSDLSLDVEEAQKRWTMGKRNMLLWKHYTLVCWWIGICTCR